MNDLECLYESDSGLSLAKVVSVFAVLGAGAAVSVLLFCGEGCAAKDRGIREATALTGEGRRSNRYDDDYNAGAEENFDMRLKSFMFRWGVSPGADPSAFAEEVQRLCRAQQGGGGERRRELTSLAAPEIRANDIKYSHIERNITSPNYPFSHMQQVSRRTWEGLQGGDQDELFRRRRG